MLRLKLMLIPQLRLGWVVARILRRVKMGFRLLLLSNRTILLSAIGVVRWGIQLIVALILFSVLDVTRRAMWQEFVTLKCHGSLSPISVVCLHMGRGFM
jgi:hypothetical protein